MFVCMNQFLNLYLAKLGLLLVLTLGLAERLAEEHFIALPL